MSSSDLAYRRAKLSPAKQALLEELLRASFQAVDGRPAQVIAQTLTLTLSVVDLHELAESEREAEAVRLATEEAQRPFDLEHGPLLRAGLVRLNATEHMLLFTMHHIV